MSNIEDSPKAAQTQSRKPDYYADPARPPAFVRDMFNRAAPHYDRVNRLFSLGTGAWYRRFCLRRTGVAPGARVVDIAVGTGLLAREALTLTGGNVIGVDVSEAMLAIAQRELAIPLIQATAEALPLGPGIADFVTMAYALRHLTDLTAALREALRVLRPGGRLMLLEISAPRNRIGRATAGLIIGGLMPRLSLLLTRDARARSLMNYHWQTILNYMPPDAVLQMLRENGFESVKCYSYLDLFHHFTGRKPLP
jgi:demethylmenaquinone methyltransferase/2-methoxy-6-polyprenyl-1,4-benzoquinol methylase